ncbi:hypothetical protein [Enterobacter cloacae]|uniref:hypothetical protein n=1 Tax=Enterobacter cloacae TaxID=550 RepID=UPI00388E5A64
MFSLCIKRCEGNSKQTFSMQSPVEANIDEKYVKELGLNGGRLASRPTDQKVVVVVRLLQLKNRAFTLQELGMSQKQIEIINRVSDIPSGVVFFFLVPLTQAKVRSPNPYLRGCSGNPGDHLITVEDPIENVIRELFKHLLLLLTVLSQELWTERLLMLLRTWYVWIQINYSWGRFVKLNQR